MFDPVHDVDTIHGLYLLLTASGNHDLLKTDVMYTPHISCFFCLFFVFFVFLIQFNISF